MKLPPDHIPAWVDKARLCAEICHSPDAVEQVVRFGKLPAGRELQGKLLWRWADVDEWLKQGGESSQEAAGSDAGRMGAAITAATRRLSRKTD